MRHSEAASGRGQGFNGEESTSVGGRYAAHCLNFTCTLRLVFTLVLCTLCLTLLFTLYLAL